jgi:hypothetical protein
MASISTAAPALPEDYIGLYKGLTVYTNGVGYYYPVLNGGGFRGTFQSGPGQSGSSFDTTVWCVDSQLFFSPGSSAEANVIRLSDAAHFNATYVRYAGVNPWNGSGSYAGEFSYDVGLGGNDIALNRYKMAAWLVSKYTGFPDGPNVNNGTDAGLKNKAIQRAIWRTIYNGVAPAGSGEITGDIDDGVVGYATWLAAAAANYASVSTSEWAVVSWDVDEDGALNNSLKKQTFLVRTVVPEPGFYGLLALGLGGLFYARQRRRNSA